MHGQSRFSQALGILLALASCVIGGGCMGLHSTVVIPEPQVPRELEMKSLPSYAVEPPDILIIDTLSVIPKPPYRIEALDALLVNATNALPNEPVSGIYGVDPEGTINLGGSYGLVSVAGLTLQEAQAKIKTALDKVLRAPTITISLASAHGMQQIRGEHLVRPDGTVGLGVYGSVYVAGLTLDQAREAMEKQLGKSLLTPKISVDVFAYNSKYCYVIADGAGYGQQIVRLPITGKETVLDAISQINGLPLVSSTKKIWVSRPNGANPTDLQILPVDWCAITKGGSPETNYQLFPNDRVYVEANSLITLNNRLTQLFAPLERVFGLTILGSAAVNSVTNATQRNGNSGGGF